MLLSVSHSTVGQVISLERSGFNLMKTTKALFFELAFNFRSERWDEFELPKLSLRELLGLAKLLGCPSCGSKETVIVRLIAQRELRLKTARLQTTPRSWQIPINVNRSAICAGKRVFGGPVTNAPSRRAR
jgi:hypothetical protein